MTKLNSYEETIVSYAKKLRSLDPENGYLTCLATWWKSREAGLPSHVYETWIEGLITVLKSFQNSSTELEKKVEMRTLTNRAGDTIQTPYNNEQALINFQNLAKEGKIPANNWIWFYLHKTVVETQKQYEERLDRSQTMKELACMFLYAFGQGMKKPRIYARYKEIRVQIYLSRRGTLCFKSATLKEGMNDKYNPAEYIGCIYQGALLPAKVSQYSKETREFTEQEKEFFEVIEKDPTGFLAQASKDCGICSYCNKPLSTKPSKLCGYGKQCANNWGLPYTDDETYLEKCPSFSKLYQESSQVQGIMEVLLEEGAKSEGWLILADYLEDYGLPRCKAPLGVVLPRV